MHTPEAKYGATVADDLTFDRVIAALSPMDREAVDRVLRHRGFGSGVSERTLNDAREESYDRGFAAGERKARSTPPVGGAGVA